MLGQKIRKKRQEKGLSLSQLATMINRTPSYLSQIERNLAEPSITSLRQIADALESPIFYFLLDEQRDGPLVRREDRKTLVFPESHQVYELLSPDLNRKIEMIQACLKPGASTCERPLSHSGEECMVVLQGEMLIQIGEEEYRLRKGDSIYYYSAIPHKITSIGDEVLVFISAITPPAF